MFIPPIPLRLCLSPAFSLICARSFRSTVVSGGWLLLTKKEDFAAIRNHSAWHLFEMVSLS